MSNVPPVNPHALWERARRRFRRVRLTRTLLQLNKESRAIESELHFQRDYLAQLEEQARRRRREITTEHLDICRRLCMLDKQSNARN
ncbi:hypothetical protein [Pandoraea fibrosis]|uniref:Uncharacterized protein n=1 Tax=Pandoraea fibrosis TaxID=1891094 RepID=A0A5E4XGM4_9BURK|nr:hypothetical protein [Pandoraea fibrosis]VVE35559.1 hypothetical protein PFI31113_03843 [Pandoraea fibrosis]